MKSIFCIITIFFSSIGFVQETKQVLIKCDVLGKQEGDVRYYHPIEGEYQIDGMQTFFFKEHQKRLKKDYAKFVFIDPVQYLTDSFTVVQANSLRHEINLDELVYINWRIGHDSLQNGKKVDSFLLNACYVRDEEYQEVVQDYFNPFLMSRFEITNKEYRQFCDWVIDSLFREAIYLHSIQNKNDFATNDEIAKMLRHEKLYYNEVNLGWQEFDPSQPSINRGLFSLNWEYDYWKGLPDEYIIPIIESFYLRPNERWYKRRELDTKKFVYKYYTVDSGILEHKVHIYPDTLSWYNGYTYNFNDPFTNMYFWHPAYDNYPVVGISYEQAVAFIDWKGRQMQREFPELMNEFELALPNWQEREWAIKLNSSPATSKIIQDNEIVTNLLLGLKEGEQGKFHELLKSGLMGYTEKVFYPLDENNPKQLLSFIKSMKKRKTHDGTSYFDHPIYEILLMRATENSLNNGVEFLSNNVSEWGEANFEDYQNLVDAYINYNCFANIDYCQYQRPQDANEFAKNDKDGRLITGSNWFDERYENTLGVNTAGIHAKTFQDKDSSYATVGFRLVLRQRQ